MKVDNLFVVESPLQALVALDLSLQFSGQKNGIVYRLSGKKRTRNDEQIVRVVERGSWEYSESFFFGHKAGLLFHLKARRKILSFKKRFFGRVDNLFFGEFRSQWMHLLRASIAPRKVILMDDGAATLIAKKGYIDKGVYYPEEIWRRERIKKLVKDIVYLGLVDRKELSKPLGYASAFLRDESDYVVNFSSLINSKDERQQEIMGSKKVFFFGSKYSEAGIINREYEFDFLCRILNFYKNLGHEVIYCSHRDESEEKLSVLESRFGINVISPELPAEIFMLDHYNEIEEIAAAYSSVINNLRLVFPGKKFRSFRLHEGEINIRKRQSIADIYDYFESQGIWVEKDF